MVIWLFLVISSYLTVRGEQHDLTLCSAMAYTFLLGFFTPKICALAFLVERTRELRNQQRPKKRRHDRFYLIQISLIIVPILVSVLWVLAKIKVSSEVYGHCGFAIPLIPLIVGPMWILTSCLVLIYRSCWILWKSRQPGARNWGQRLVIALLAITVVSLGYLVIIIVAQGAGYTAFFMLFAYIECILTSWLGQYLICWNSLYKQIRSVDSAWRRSTPANLTKLTTETTNSIPTSDETKGNTIKIEPIVRSRSILYGVIEGDTAPETAAVISSHSAPEIPVKQHVGRPISTQEELRAYFSSFAAETSVISDLRSESASTESIPMSSTRTLNQLSLHDPIADLEAYGSDDLPQRDHHHHHHHYGEHRDEQIEPVRHRNGSIESMTEVISQIRTYSGQNPLSLA